MNNIDVAAIIAAHADHVTGLFGGCHDDRSLPREQGEDHCETYRLAEALTAEQKLRREWRDEAWEARTELAQAHIALEAFADQPKQA